MSAWANDDWIWTYFKEQNKIHQPGLMGVAQEKNFYRLIDLNEAEEKFLEKFIDYTSKPVVKGLNHDFLKMFTLHTKLKKVIDDINDTVVDKDKVNESLKELEQNLMEEAHSKIEKFGFELLKIRSLPDLIAIDQDDGLFEAILYICIQYFRTKNTRKTVLKNFEGDRFEEMATKTYNILCFTLATNLTREISLNKNLRFLLLHNNSDIKFITGDQPVVNLCETVNELGEVIDLDWFYPLNPTLALKLHFSTHQKEKFDSSVIDSIEVDKLNLKIFENSNFFVFANCKEQLERYYKDN